NCVMIGDTKFDIIGANEAGIDSVGVTYGYGTREELVENRATYLVDDLYAWFEENVWGLMP
ncbi:MAG: HAD hydrolase-like protein, partial [Lachnospiraceae bacterium]|nr:HAD hydrolase-like protein [Lachnospiraceae bacterium]